MGRQESDEEIKRNVNKQANIRAIIIIIIIIGIVLTHELITRTQIGAGEIQM